MTYKKYNTKDNAFGNLLSSISASATSINLESGHGSRFPSGNFILTFVQYTTTGDATTPIIAQEQVYVENRATDALTVVRGQNGTTPVSFDVGDNVYLNVVSAIVKDVQDEVTRLESDKLDITAFNSTLRNNLGNWKIIYTNGSGDETELALGSAGQFLKSNGASSAPTWEAPTVDISGLTENTTELDNNDRLVMYNGTTNVKRPAKATTTVEGMVRNLTSPEIGDINSTQSGTVSGSQVWSRYGFDIVAGDTNTLTSDLTEDVSIDSGVLLKTYTSGIDGTIRLNFESKIYKFSSRNNHIVLKKNGVIIATYNSGSSGAYFARTIDSTVSIGDIFRRETLTSSFTNGSSEAGVKNVYIKYDTIDKRLGIIPSGTFA